MSDDDNDGKGAKKRKLRALPGLSVEQFRHPNDARATDALKKIPGLDKLLAKILEYGLERLYYVDNVASNLRVTPAMFGRLHRSLTWACKILDVSEPEMYVTVDPAPNAFTYGHTKPFITLTSGLVDLMSDEELFFVIGHEVGHIKAGHVLYGTMARNIAAVVALLGEATFGIGALLGRGLVVALLEWYRCAELTADRAALLCVQDLEPARDTFMKRRRHDAARRRAGSRRVLAPGARLRGRRSFVARPRLQDLADARAHASVRDAARQGARAVARGRLRRAARASVAVVARRNPKNAARAGRQRATARSLTRSRGGTRGAECVVMHNTTTASILALDLDVLTRVRGGCGKKEQPAPQVVPVPMPCQDCGGGVDVSVQVATGGAQPRPV